MKFKRLIAAFATVVAMVVGVPALTAAPASAATSDCYAYTVCIYYNSSGYGFNAVYIQTGDTTYSGKYFSAGNNGNDGAGKQVLNNGAAIDSWYYGSFRVSAGSGGGCAVACQTFAAWATFKDFNTTMKNHNVSGNFL